MSDHPYTDDQVAEFHAAVGAATPVTDCRLCRDRLNREVSS